jgi:large subunit ribosomal protein L33
MKKERLIKLQCQECKSINYCTGKNKKTITKKIELKKHCKSCRKHTLHKETKK